MTTIKLSKKAIIPKNYPWTVEYHEGKTSFDPNDIVLHLEPEQEKRYIKGEILAKRMKGKGLNANVLEYLLKHPKLIPEEWKGKGVYFWGTIYRGAVGRLYIRGLCWFGDGWRWACRWLDDDWFGSDPAAVSALDITRESSISPQNSVLDPSPSNLDLAIETVRKAGYKVEKVKNWYITGRGEVMDMPSNKVEARKKFLGAYATEEEAQKASDEIRSKYGNQ